MHEMTAANLRSAFGGESMAHMRYKIFADKAIEEGFANVARLFRAVSAAEQVHATNHFEAMKDAAGAFSVSSMAGFGLDTTGENLTEAIAGETFEVQEMYPVYLDTARAQGEIAARRSFQYALAAEEIHAAMYTQAKQAVDAGKDVTLGPVQVCKVCGYTVEGDAPGKCPVCSATKDKFEAFE